MSASAVADGDIPPCVAGNFDTDTYNVLLLVSKAEALLKKKLESAGLGRAQLFSQLPHLLCLGRQPIGPICCLPYPSPLQIKTGRAYGRNRSQH